MDGQTDPIPASAGAPIPEATDLRVETVIDRTEALLTWSDASSWFKGIETGIVRGRCEY